MLAGCGKAYPFQSTFPRGERLKNIFNIDAGYNFNPRSLVGNDGKGFLCSVQDPYFNPRSLVGND